MWCDSYNEPILRGPRKKDQVQVVARTPHTSTSLVNVLSLLSEQISMKMKESNLITPDRTREFHTHHRCLPV